MPHASTNRARLREAMVAALAGLRARRAPAAKLDAAGVPASPINTIGEMFADPQAIARGMRLDLDDGHGNTPSFGSLADACFPKRRSLTSVRRRGSASTQTKFSPNWRRNEAGWNEDGRTADRRSTRGKRRRPHLLRAGRILSRRARRALRFADQDHRLPAGRRCGDDGRLRRPADRPAGHLLCHARTWRDQRLGRRPHRQAGFQPDDPVHRPDRRPRQGARGLPGGRLQALLRRHRQMGGRDRRRRAHPRARHPRFCSGDLGPAGAGRHLAAGGHADQRGGSAASALPRRRSRPRPASTRCCSWRNCWPRPSGPSPSSAARAGARRRSACSSAQPRAGRCRSAAPSAARCCSTICTPATPAMSASAPTRSSRRRSRRPILCCWSAGAWARCRRPTIRC